MAQACCSAALRRPGVATLGCSQAARPHSRFARSWSLCCCILACATSRRYAIAAGACPKVPQAQMIEDRLRGVSRDCFLAICECALLTSACGQERHPQSVKAMLLRVMSVGMAASDTQDKHRSSWVLENLAAAPGPECLSAAGRGMPCQAMPRLVSGPCGSQPRTGWLVTA